MSRPKGSKLTEEHKAKIGAANKGKRRTVELKARLSASHKIANNRPEVRAKRKATARKRWAKPGVKESQSAFMKKVMNRPEVKAKLKKPKSEQGKANIRATANHPEVKARRSIISKRIWSNPELRNQVREKMKQYVPACLQPGPKPRKWKSERMLERIINEAVPNTFMFVGNRQFRIGSGKGRGCYRWPDFVAINGRRLLIELFGSYFHGEHMSGMSKEEAEQERISWFARFGWRTLIIWDKELQDVEQLKQRIRRFTYEE